MQYEYISADNHLDKLWIPGNLWRERLPAHLREAGPKIVESDSGTSWEWEGRLRGAAADGADNAKYIERFRSKGANIEDGALPPSEAEYLLEHMDMSKIYAGVTFGDVRKWDVADPELLVAVYRAYNDFVLEINQANPDRLVMLPNIPTALPEACPAEIERVAKLGARGVEFCPFDVGKPVYDEVWEATWAVAEDTGLAICAHIGGKADSAVPPYGRGASIAFLSTAPFNIANTCAELIFSAVFERHPKLQWLFGECRIGWLPFFIQWMDRQVVERKPDAGVPITLLPSEYIDRQIRFAFEEDYIGTRLLEFDWSKIQNCVVWGSDYPHDQGTWPDVSPPLDKMFEGIDPTLRKAVLFDRTAEMFGIKGPYTKDR
jgi:predicted TIM-barrel fold metal-dependent hydrolase